MNNNLDSKFYHGTLNKIGRFYAYFSRFVGFVNETKYVWILCSLIYAAIKEYISIPLWYLFPITLTMFIMGIPSGYLLFKLDKPASYWTRKSREVFGWEPVIAGIETRDLLKEIKLILEDLNERGRLK